MKSNFVQFFCIRYNIFVTKHQIKRNGLKYKNVCLHRRFNKIDMLLCIG